MAEAKQALKDARDAINKKDYKEALKQCKIALKLEPKNYTAWVFAGVATFNLEQFDQSEQAYKKAIEIDGKNVLAWKGLAELFVKINNSEKLIEVYKALIETSTDEKKTREYQIKLSESYKSIGNRKEAIAVWKQLLSSSNTPESILQIWTSIATLQEEIEQDIIKKEAEKRMPKLPPKKVISKDEENQLLNEREKQVSEERLKFTELDEIYNNIKSLGLPHTFEYNIKYIQRLQRRRKLAQGSIEIKNQIIEECIKTIKQHPNCYYAYECLILIQDEDLDDKSARLDDQILSKMYIKILHMFPDKGLGWIGLGIVLSNQNTIKTHDRKQLVTLNEEPRAFLTKGLKFTPESVNGWIRSVELLLENLSFQSVVESVGKALVYIDRRKSESGANFAKATLTLKLLAAKSYQRSKKRDLASTTYDEILQMDPGNIEAMKGLGEMCLDDKEYEESKNWFLKILQVNSKEHFAIAQLGNIDYLLGNLESAKDKLIEAISISNEIPKYFFWLGRVYWQLGGEFRTNKKYAQLHFLQAAKLDPDFSSNFTYLGHFYRMVEKDTDKAKRCYQKAFALDALDEEAGISLSDIFLSQGQQSLAVNLYREVTSKSNRVKWAWLRLALYQQGKKQYDEAVISFQNALRSEANDAICWQGLAETYRRQGKYAAALRAFSRASQIDPSLNYSQYQVAAMQKLLGLSENSMHQFEVVLKFTPNYLPALKGLGESYLSISEEQIKQGLLSRAAYSLFQAIDTFKKCTEIDPSINCTFKLLGDAYTHFFHLPAALCNKKLLEQIDFEDINIQWNSDFKQKLSILEEGAQAYRNAIHVDKTSAALAYDLGVNLIYQARTHQEKATQSKLLMQANNSFKNAVSQNPNDAAFWVGLGISESSPQKQQHAFIKALQLDESNFNAWNNLGILYIQYGKLNSARLAFENSALINPSQAIAWLGQGIVNEISSSDKTNIKKAHKSYRNALAAASESPQVYLSAAYTSLAQGDLETASFALRKYTEFQPLDAAGHNLHGLILERQGMLRFAEREFGKSIELLQQEKHGFESHKPTSVANATLCSSENRPTLDFRRNIVLLNRSRVQSAIGEVEKAISENSKGSPIDFFTQLSLAVSYYRAKQYEKCIQAFDVALKMGDDSLAPEIMILLSQLYFKIGNTDKARERIASCAKQYPQHRKTWEVMCTMALSLKDFKIAQVALENLRKFEGSIHSIDLYILNAHFHLLQGNVTLAQNFICRGIHIFPTRLHLWNELNNIISHYQKDSLIISNVSRDLSSPLCEKTPSNPNQSHLNIGKRYSDLLNRDKTIIRLQELTYSHLLFGKLSPQIPTRKSIENSFRFAQLSIHSNPLDVQTWYLLAISSFARAVVSKQLSSWQTARKSIEISLKNINDKHQNAHYLKLALGESYLFISLQSSPKEKQTLIQQAIDLAIDVSKKFPSDPKLSGTAFRLQGRSQLVLKNISEAVKFYKQAIQINPQEPTLWQELSVIYEQDGNSQAAEYVLQKALSVLNLDTQNRLNTLLRYSNLLFKNKQYKIASEMIDKALALQPYSAAGLLLKGMLLIKMGASPQESEEQLQQALMTDPNTPGANYYLSLAHFQAKDYETAESDLFYEKDIEFKTDAIYYQLGIDVCEEIITLLARVGTFGGKDNLSMKALLQKAIHLNPANEIYWKELELLSKK